MIKRPYDLPPYIHTYTDEWKFLCIILGAVVAVNLIFAVIDFLT
jgi:hypothetical protein